jgi:uncharacterized membrane protein YbhN (UPF0104 family)
MIRRVLLILILVAFVLLVLVHLKDLAKLTDTLATAQWQWVLFAGLCQIIYFVFLASSLQAAFEAVGVESRLRDVLPVTFGALFVNLLAPTGGAAGTALFVDDANRRGKSPARAATGTVLQQLADYGAFRLVMLAGLAYLFSRNDLTATEIFAGTVLLLIVGGLLSFLRLALLRPGWLRRFLKWVQDTLRRAFAAFNRPSLSRRAGLKKPAADSSRRGLPRASTPKNGC